MFDSAGETSSPPAPAGVPRAEAPRPDRRPQARAGAGEPVDGLTIAVSQPQETTVVVRALGELDLLSAPRCARILAGAVRTVAPGSPASGTDRVRGRVVCDVDGVDFVAASGLGMLVEASDDAVAHDVDLVVVASNRPVLRPLSVTGLDRHLTLVARLDDAVQQTFTC